MLSLALRIIPAKRVYNFVARAARGSHEDRKRTAISLWSYRFSIRSCLATSHKQILKTPFSMASSCILGFQATRLPTWAHFIHPLFTTRWRILALEDLTPKERWPELQREQWRRRPVRSGRSSRMAQWYEASLFFAGGSWGAVSNPRGATFIFFFHRVLPFGLLLFILIADPIADLIISCFWSFLLKTRERNNCCKRASISSSRLIWTRLITRIYTV